MRVRNISFILANIKNIALSSIYIWLGYRLNKSVYDLEPIENFYIPFDFEYAISLIGNCILKKYRISAGDTFIVLGVIMLILSLIAITVFKQCWKVKLFTSIPVFVFKILFILIIWLTMDVLKEALLETCNSLIEKDDICYIKTSQEFALQNSTFLDGRKFKNCDNLQMCANYAFPINYWWIFTILSIEFVCDGVVLYSAKDKNPKGYVECGNKKLIKENV